jgi:hypothetical protein
MKVYLFDVDSGLYEGEDYSESEELDEREGITTLAPPVGQPGQVPVYDRSLGDWKLVHSDSLRGKG